jgi:hypothetical protein
MGEAYQKVENRITESTQKMNDLKSARPSQEADMTEMSVRFFPEQFADGFFAGGGVGGGLGCQSQRAAL